MRSCVGIGVGKVIKKCEMCGEVLWECSAYSSSRADFLLKLQEKLRSEYECFEALNSPSIPEKSSRLIG